MKNEKTSWLACPECLGRGKKSRRLSQKVKRNYKLALSAFEKAGAKGAPPARPKGHLYTCLNCKGSGLLQTAAYPKADEKTFPHVAIIGGGIGGVALAVACLHRKIPFTLYERDNNFEARSQGYGLTLQQATRAIEGLGISSLKDGIVSTRHIVHTTEGKIIGEWGMRKWMDSDACSSAKRTNIHIARQSLRAALLEQLESIDVVQWGHQFMGFTETKNDEIQLTFQVNGQLKNTKADLIVGADGIRSEVRKLLIGEEKTPLRYLGCIVILGICPLASLESVDNPLLDSATVFQTANGNERIYMMPYSSDTIMWQLSFPMSSEEAKKLSAKGAPALKEEACRRTQWHTPIPEILAATPATKISGYPVYDRALLEPELLAKNGALTLIGDAAHPMSPFKGQGANQALLDALALARDISIGCNALSNWRENGIRKNVLTKFESEMLVRSATKVKDSAEAAAFLHSDIVLHKGNEPRGRVLKRENS